MRNVRVVQSFRQWALEENFSKARDEALTIDTELCQYVVAWTFSVRKPVGGVFAHRVPSHCRLLPAAVRWDSGGGAESGVCGTAHRS